MPFGRGLLNPRLTDLWERKTTKEDRDAARALERLQAAQERGGVRSNCQSRDPLSTREQEGILSLSARGMTGRDVANTMRVSESSVSRVVRRGEVKRPLLPEERGGRPRLFPPGCPERRLMRAVADEDCYGRLTDMVQLLWYAGRGRAEALRV